MLKRVIVAGALGLAAFGTGQERAAAQSLSVVTEACAQMADTPLGKHVIGTIGRVLVLRSELDVTAEQRAQIRATVLEHVPDLVETAQGVVQEWRTLGDAVLAEEIDEKAIRNAAAEFGATIGDAAIARAKLVRQLRGVLNDEQIAAIKAFRAEQLGSIDRLLERAATDK
jgi:Spy/CpxP family protein refolding chaperone